MAVTDITKQTDAELDEIYEYLLSEHRGATGDHRIQVHDAIMLCCAEYSRRIDTWLAARS